MNNIHYSVLALLSATSSLCAQALPSSSTLPRGDVKLNNDYMNVATHGYGSWRTVAPRERIAAGPAGTVPTAQVAYVTYMDTINGIETIEFRRSTNGGYSWGAPVSLYSLVPGEVISSNETRIVASEHDVFIVFASNAHTLAAGLQSVWAIGSSDQGQTWTAPQLLTPQFLTTLRDADEVNAAVSRGPNGASLNVVFEADSFTLGVEDIYFVQAEIQGGTLAVTVAETRLNYAVAAQTSDVNFTAIASDGPVVHVAWTDNRSQGGSSQYDYFSMTSLNNGTDFAAVTEYRHTQFAGPISWAAPRRPRVAVDIPHVYTFMEHGEAGRDDVYMAWSADVGLTWTATNVAINTATLGSAGDIDDMIVTADDGRVAVVYVDDRLNGINNNNNNQAIVSVSNNGGADFVAGTYVEVPLSLKDPNPIFGIEMTGDMIAVLYETNCGPGGEDLAVSLSSDGGQTFTHYDVTDLGACGTFPSGVDVDNPRLALTANGDVIVTYIDDRTPAGSGGGNTVNNLWITGIHYPQLIDRTASNQGLVYQDDAPSAAGDTCYVVLSFTGPQGTIALDNLGTTLNVGFDAFTEASIVVAASAFPSVNRDSVGANGSVQFPFFPNVTQLLGLPLWGVAFTASGILPGKFTDPILFQ